MPKSNESINRELFDLLSTRGYRPTMLDTSGKEIPVPEEAEVFQFNFVKDDVDYGVVTISIDGLHKLVIYFNDKIADSEKEVSDTDDVSWYRLLNHLKRFAKNRQLSFQVKNTDHLKHDMAKRDHMKKLDEGYYPIGKNKSYSDAVPQVKIVIEHTRNIVEGEQRYRNVARIFVENTDGERFLLPTIKPGIARVYARHIAEGGTPYDDRANHITSLVEDYNKMAGFVRATRNGQFNESAQRLVLEGANHYTKLRETLSRMAGGRGYNKYFESWTPSLMEDEVEETNLNELFVQETLDPRIESVMPILSKLQKNLGEMKEVDALAEWADKLLEGGDGGEASEEPPESKEGETAEDGNEAPEDDLSEAAGAETLSHNDETEEGNLKAFDLEEGFADAIKKGINALDRIVTGGNKEDLLKDLKQKAGVRNPENGKPSMAYSDVEKRVAEEVDTGQYDAVKSSPKGSDGNNWDKPFREKVRQYAKELEKRQKEKEQGVAEGSKEKTPGIALSKAYKKDFDNKKPGQDRAETALTGTYSKTGKPGGELKKQGVAEADELRARGGLAAVNKKPRIGQTDMRNIPVGNHPDARINKFTDKDRAEHPANLKAKIKSTLGKHTRPNLPESGVTESEFAGDYATGEAGQWRNKGPKANKPATIGDLVGENVEEGKGPLGQGDLGLALKSLGGSWSSWHEEDSHDPDIEVYEYDDGEGGYYASGSIEHNLKTGEIEVHYQDGENDVDVDGTFNSIGDAMKALRGGNSYPSWGGKKPNFDRLGQRKQHGPDDLRKTDRTGRKGTLAGGPTNQLKQNIQWSKGKHGPKGVLPEGQEDLDTIKRLLGEGWKGEFAGGTLGGVGGTVAGSALGALAGGPVGAAIGGVVGGAAGGTAGQMAGRELTKEEQLNEVAPLLAAGARAIMPLLAKVGPKLGQMASGAGKAGAEVAGKTATGIGRGTVDVAKSAAGSAAQNAGQIGVGVGAYQAITDVADKMVGGVGEVYRDVGKAAGAIAQSVGDAIDGKTIAELASTAVKYSIPIGILLAVLYGGKKLIDQVMSEGADDSEMGAVGQMVGKITPNPSDFVAGFKKTFEGQEDLDTIKRLLGK